MSRLAKKPIASGKAEVTVSGDMLTVKGSKATLTKRVHPVIDIATGPEGVMVTTKNRSKLARSLVGTFASHVRNMIAGVETPYKKVLILEGVGYKVELKGTELILLVGKSHPVSVQVPSDVTVTVLKNSVTIESPNKESVGQFAAEVRAVKPPEPYLGKGLRFDNEVVRRKQGKKAV